jgi:DNA transformation protein
MKRPRSKPRQLADLPNIGPVLAARLKRAGIRTPAQLAALGSVEALCRLTAKAGGDGQAPCPNTLYAVEGAIRGIRWHGMDKDQRAELWREYQRRLQGDRGSSE